MHSEGPALADACLDVTPERLLDLRRYIRAGAGGRWHPDLRPAGFPGRRRGAGLETIDVRPFVEGDDVRHLDRNVTARTGLPHVRSFREERGATVLLVADFRAPMLWGTRRVLRSVAAAEALVFLNREHHHARAAAAGDGDGAGERPVLPEGEVPLHLAGRHGNRVFHAKYLKAALADIAG